MANTPPPKKGPRMATVSAPIRRKTAKEKFLDSFGELIDQAEQTMSVRDFHKAADKSNKALDRALDRQKRRSGTA
jgi:hypothetical protein